MAVAKVERRLLAVLAADVVGYTRLMEADEARTIARLKAVRAEVAGPLVVQHHGRLVNFVGDSALAAFESVVDAVSCAVDIQRVVAERNAGLPEAERLLFRVGVTLADVALLDGEVYGDGVNLAARLGQLCEPGGVVVSGTAYDHLQGKLDGLPLDFAGEHRVKNVARPVRVYRVRLDGRPAGRHLPRGLLRHAAAAALPAAALAVGLWWRWTPAAPPPADKPSVAVLPFENLSGDPAQAYLGEGFADDVITELARSRELTVLARDTSFSLKGRSEGADAAARAFGVRYLLGGSLRRTGESLRLTAWLEDTASGRQVWAERYDIGAPALVATQDDIAHRVAATLSSEVREAEKAGSLRRTPGSLDVYELALRGLALKHEFTADSFRAGRAVLRRAIELDPDYAPAYVYLGYLDAIDGIADYTGERRQEDLDAAIATIRKGIGLDPGMAYAYQALGYALSVSGRPADALRAMERALELGPNDADNLLLYGRELASNGRYAEAVAAGERAFALDPVAPVYYPGLHSRSLYGAGQYEAVVRVTESCIDRRSYHRTCRAMRIAALVELGRTEQARAETADFVAHASGFTLRNAGATVGFAGDPATTERLVGKLREAGLPEG